MAQLHCSILCMNPKKFRGWCLNGCCNEVKKGATKYCSLRCEQSYHFRLRAAILESGEYLVLTRSMFIRKYLVRALGERCSRCGWAQRHPTTGRIPVEVEHLDGDWRNNHPSNLTLLCPNCHSLTDTYRALNRGRGRSHRLGGRSAVGEDNPQHPGQTSGYIEGKNDDSKQLGLF
jgi:hypothetical protein